MQSHERQLIGVRCWHVALLICDIAECSCRLKRVDSLVLLVLAD